MPYPEGIVTAGPDNTGARSVCIREGEAINTRASGAMFARMIADDRAGG